MSEPAEVALEIPARPEFVGTGRIMIASLARRNGFGEEQIEDLKIAVSEALTEAIRGRMASGDQRPVRLLALVSEHSMTIEIDAGPSMDDVGQLGATPAAGMLEGGLGLSLIRSLFADSSVEDRPRGPVLRLVVKREDSEV